MTLGKSIPLFLLCVTFQDVMAERLFDVDTEKSSVRIELGTAGLFRFLGHNHRIEAPIDSGRVTYDAVDPSRSSVDIEVLTASLRVLDPGLSGKDRAQVQETMESERVLDVQHFPVVSFHSDRVTRQGEEILVNGRLQVRGVTRAILLRCRIDEQDDELRIRGESKLKQKDFGIQPVKAGGGTVNVKNEFKVLFDVRAVLVK